MHWNSVVVSVRVCGCGCVCGGNIVGIDYLRVGSCLGVRVSMCGG